jgi:hypothetical protein
MAARPPDMVIPLRTPWERLAAVTAFSPIVGLGALVHPSGIVRAIGVVLCVVGLATAFVVLRALTRRKMRLVLSTDALTLPVQHPFRAARDETILFAEIDRIASRPAGLTLLTTDRQLFFIRAELLSPPHSLAEVQHLLLTRLDAWRQRSALPPGPTLH